MQHNTANDCWLIIQNSVYNLTQFIKQHPGGSDVLLARAGEDATSYFITKHGQNKSVINRLSVYKIGELPAHERVTANDFDEIFLAELLDSCYKEKLYASPKWYSNSLFWIRLINVLIFFCLSVLVLYSHMPLFVRVILVVFQAVIGTSLFGFIAHEDTHQNFTKNLFSKLLLRAAWPVFWPFISQNPLKYEHNSHHIKIGDPEFDYEVAAFSSVMRYSGHVEHKPIHKYQHKFAKFFYPFYANIITTFGGINSLFWDRHNRKVGLEHTISVLVSLVYFIALPSFFRGEALTPILLYIVYQSTLYYGIYVGAAINHFVPSASEAIPAEHKNKYAYYVCHNTTNFCSSSFLWFWYTGGFNIQIEHHLIPFIPVENLKRMTPIVQHLCLKHGYPYRTYKSFLHLWRDHYIYLFNLSKPNAGNTSEMINKTTYQGR